MRHTYHRDGMNTIPRRILVALVTAAATVCGPASALDESPRQWFLDGQKYVAQAKKRTPSTNKAKNVILFVGDGMSISTVTAARILEGQLRGASGEENELFFETFPNVALVKTYNVDLQTPDSAGTMTAIITGVKTRAGFLSVSQVPKRGDISDADRYKLTTLIEVAERAGLATGIVTTARVTHATPGACYAHAPERWWENDALLPQQARDAGFPDIARQLLDFDVGDGIEVVLGGGRTNFLPATSPDPEYPDRTGARRDGRDLIKQWLKTPQAYYVWNRRQLDELDMAHVSRLLGLFEPGHMHYEHDRDQDAAGEPSLAEMTEKAISLLARNNLGYVLVVEGGRIDHAHHLANAYRALTDTIALAEAVRVARRKTRREDTLIIVTADHSDPLVMAGYAARGNPILGNVTNAGPYATPGAVARDGLGLPFGTLSYANGPGYAGASASQPEGPKHYLHAGEGFKPASSRPDLTGADTTDPDHLQECMVPLVESTHAGEDVPLYADGPGAQLFGGVIEQNVIFHVIVEALGLEASPPGAPAAAPDR